MRRRLTLVTSSLLLGLGAMAGADGNLRAVTNLVRNGGFEEADPAGTNKPVAWDLPDGLGVQWASAGDGQTGRYIRMNTGVSESAMAAQWKQAGIDQWEIPKATGDAVAASYGLSYYSDRIPVQTGQAYRIAFRYRGAGGGAKVWVRGYGTLRGRERRLYETIVNCARGGEDWIPYSQPFHPTTNTPGVTSVKVMLFAYWPPGVYGFDDVSMEPVSLEAWAAEMQGSR